MWVMCLQIGEVSFRDPNVDTAKNVSKALILFLAINSSTSLNLFVECSLPYKNHQSIFFSRNINYDLMLSG